VRMMWLVDKGFASGDGVYFAMTKIGMYLVGPPTSGWVIHSPNILTAATPEEIIWRTLPGNDGGIRQYNDTTNIHGCGNGTGLNITADCVASESHVVPLDPDFYSSNYTGKPRSLYVTFRTVSGFMGAQVSYDGGHQFDDVPTPGNLNNERHPWAMHGVEPGSRSTMPRPLKQPRGPMTPRRIDTSKLAKPGGADFIMLYYNDGIVPEAPTIGSFNGRNPYWLVPGWISKDTHGDAIAIEWGEPEVGLYAPAKEGGCDHTQRIGYPDFIQKHTSTGGLDLWITETAKVSAKIHLVSDRLVQGLLYQKSTDTQPTVASLGRFKGTGKPQTVTFKTWPTLPYGVNAPAETGENQGLGLTLWLEGYLGRANRTLLRAGGVALHVIAGTSRSLASLELELVDATTKERYGFRPDNECSRWLNLPGPHFVGFTVDAGARIASVVVDGVLCDGGPQAWWIHPKQGDNFQGFGFLSANVSSFTGSKGADQASVGAFVGEVALYGGRLLHGDLLGAFRAYRKQHIQSQEVEEEHDRDS